MNEREREKKKKWKMVTFQYEPKPWNSNEFSYKITCCEADKIVPLYLPVWDSLDQVSPFSHIFGYAKKNATMNDVTIVICDRGNTGSCIAKPFSWAAPLLLYLFIQQFPSNFHREDMWFFIKLNKINRGWPFGSIVVELPHTEKSHWQKVGKLFHIFKWRWVWWTIEHASSSSSSSLLNFSLEIFIVSIAKRRSAKSDRKRQARGSGDSRVEDIHRKWKQKKRWFSRFHVQSMAFPPVAATTEIVKAATGVSEWKQRIICRMLNAC